MSEPSAVTALMIWLNYCKARFGCLASGWLFDLTALCRWGFAFLANPQGVAAEAVVG